MLKYWEPEIIATVMLMITMICYRYKSWLNLRKNYYFQILLYLLLSGMLIDIVTNTILGIFRNEDSYAVVPAFIANSVVLLICFVFFIYEMAVIVRLPKMKTKRYLFFYTITLVLIIASVVYLFLQLMRGHIQQLIKGSIYMETVFGVSMIVYLAMAVIIILIHAKKVGHNVVIILVACNLGLITNIIFNLTFARHYLMSYYLLSIAVVFLYLGLHNVDQYKANSSQCFSNTGFHKYLDEKSYYGENISCLAMCILNVEGITNMCSQEEIDILNTYISDFISDYYSTQDVFQIHSFEYVMVSRSEELSLHKYEHIKSKIPKYFRIQNKNVPIQVCFYTAQFSDVEYKPQDYIWILNSMKQISLSGKSDNTLVNFSGNEKKQILYRLDQVQTVNACIANKDICLDSCLLSSVDHTEYEMEFYISEQTENSGELDQEGFWDGAEKLGYMYDVGIIVCKKVFQYTQKEKIFDKGVHKIHINIHSKQLDSEQRALSYINLMDRYNIRPEDVVFEITVNEDICESELKKGLDLLHRHGVTLLYDQFGANVCNLKNVLNLPFECAKINHLIVQAYLNGQSNQLPYIVEMLDKNNWAVALDGIGSEDNLQQFFHSNGNAISYYQGEYVYSNITDDKLKRFLAKEGRSES